MESTENYKYALALLPNIFQISNQLLVVDTTFFLSMQYVALAIVFQTLVKL